MPAVKGIAGVRLTVSISCACCAMRSGSGASALGVGGRGDRLAAQEERDVDVQVLLEALDEVVAGLGADVERAHDAVASLGQHGRRGHAHQAAVHAPHVVGQIAAQRIGDDLGAGDVVAVLLVVVARARDDPPLVVDRDQRGDAAAGEVGDQRVEAVLHRLVNDVDLARAARRRVERLGDDRVATQLGHAVDPVVGVDLEHLLGGVLRAIEALPLERGQLLHRRARRHQGYGHRQAGGEGNQDEPDLR